MNSRSEDVARRQMRRIIKMIHVAIFVISPAAHALIGNKAYASEARSEVSLPFEMCATGSRKACVVDGDTIWLNGQKIRIADIDKQWLRYTLDSLVVIIPEFAQKPIHDVGMALVR